MHASFKFPLQLQLQEQEDKNFFFFFSENDENQDQVLIHLSLLIRMGTQGRPVNNRKEHKARGKKEGRRREAACEKNNISMADLLEQLSGG